MKLDSTVNNLKKRFQKLEQKDIRLVFEEQGNYYDLGSYEANGIKTPVAEDDQAILIHITEEKEQKGIDESLLGGSEELPQTTVNI